jgi:hypothetical protein
VLQFDTGDGRCYSLTQGMESSRLLTWYKSSAAERNSAISAASARESMAKAALCSSRTLASEMAVNVGEESLPHSSSSASAVCSPS